MSRINNKRMISRKMKIRKINKKAKNGKSFNNLKRLSNFIWSILHIVMPKNVQEKNSKGLNYSQLWIKRKNSKVLSFPLLVKNKPLLKIYNTPKSMESVLLTVVGTEFKKQESSDSNMKGSFIKYF